tara:strand:- start:4584 stop:5153 length:570 start_codon:yes stop_codon:yes gene_type:complete
MSFPTDPEFAALDMRLNYNNVRSETRSGRTQVRNIGAAYWTFTARYPRLTRDKFAPIMAFLAGTRGGTDSFSVTPPVISDSGGDAAGSLLANGAHSAGDRTIAMDGITGTIKAGDVIKFANHDKVYMVVEDFTSGIMTIEPGLVASVSDDEAVTYNAVPFKMRMAGDVQQFRVAGYEQYQIELDLIEVI